MLTLGYLISWLSGYCQIAVPLPTVISWGMGKSVSIDQLEYTLLIPIREFMLNSESGISYMLQSLWMWDTVCITPSDTNTLENITTTILPTQSEHLRQIDHIKFYPHITYHVPSTRQSKFTLEPAEILYSYWEE